MNLGAEARRYLLRRRHGVLSTLSRKFAGYPFGSVTPYLLDHAARPVILISKLAEHTRNIDADPRVSLLVRDTGDDVQAGARLTLIGDAGRATDMPESLRARYVRYVPDAERLLALGDFSFYRIEPRQLRFIGGFGAIHWIAAENYAPPANEFADQESAIIAHMNADHGQALRDYCRFYHRVEPMIAALIGIDCDGFDVRADGEILRFDFERAVTNGAEARAALIAMAQASRAT
jgi:putative heme iron utilization protein